MGLPVKDSAAVVKTKHQPVSDKFNRHKAPADNRQTAAETSASCQLIEQKKNWAALIAVDGVGSRTLFSINDYLKQTQISWPDFWVNAKQIWSKIGLNKKTVESIKKFKKEHSIDSYWRRLERKKVTVVSCLEKNYPSLLQTVDDKPPLLFVKGPVEICQQLPIAIVGTRHATAYGRLVTEKISRELVYHQAVIISGFMYGVDLISQQTAIASGGKTVGVLGFGFDHFYPASHQDIMQDMLKTGRAAFISEFPPWVEPNRGTFPRRNRIIAALSLAVVVTEAGPKSGTQITVGSALDYGRDVFAVSGPVTSPYHLGVKKMLNQGAALVSSGQDVISDLSARHWGEYQEQIKVNSKLNLKTGESRQSIQDCSLSSLESKIMTALETVPLTTKQLHQDLRQEAVSLSQALVNLELKGLIECEANQWRLRRLQCRWVGQ